MTRRPIRVSRDGTTLSQGTYLEPSTLDEAILMYGEAELLTLLKDKQRSMLNLMLRFLSTSPEPCGKASYARQFVLDSRYREV